MKRKVDRSIYRVTKRRFALSRVGPSGSPPLLAEPVFPCPIKDRPVASRCFTREGSRLFLPSPPRNCRFERDKGIRWRSVEPIIDYRDSRSQIENEKKEKRAGTGKNDLSDFFPRGEVSNEEWTNIRRIRDLIKRCGGDRGERAAGFLKWNTWKGGSRLG